MLSAAEIISTLKLEPHPEGGWFRQTFRDIGPDERGHSTAIYFLLESGKPSHWHKVHGSSEVWLYHAGAPIRLKLSEDGKTETHHLLGMGLAAGERPQLIVPPGWWQAAETIGDWTLVSCTVAPGFLFENFELAEPGWTPGQG
jgi:predicted cupin superfamily sugar epimerase